MIDNPEVRPLKAPLLRIAALLLCLTPLGSADTIQGRVVDSLGGGVQNVDIDALDLDTGNFATLANDGTDANGNFVTTIPAGRYQLVFTPPAPPTTTHLIETIDEIIIVGTIDLGTVALPPGVALSGHCITNTSAPVADVNLDVVDEVTKEHLLLINDRTDAFGNFIISVPAHAIEVRFDTSGVFGMTLASRAIDLAPSAATNMGDVVLPPGFFVSGFLKKTGGAAVVSADLDFNDSVTGDKAYTPGDNTQSDGSFSVVVAAGSWDVEFCPKFADLLVATEVLGVVVTTTTNLGTITLQPGVVLFGSIVAYDGSIPAGSDVDVRDSTTGLSIVTCGDNTNAQGDYAIVVPTGTLDVTFNPPSFTLPLGSELHPSVAVAGTTLLDGVLPYCPPGANYGTGIAGTGGVVPHLGDSGGSPRPHNASYAWELQDGVGGGVAILVAGTGAWSVPLKGGTLLVNLTPGTYSTFLLPLGGAAGSPGAGSRTFPFPTPVLDFVGLTVYGQFAVLDAGAVQNVALSEGLSLTICL